MALSALIQLFRRLRLAARGVRFNTSCRIGTSVSIGDRSALQKRNSVIVGANSDLSHGVELNPWDGHIHIGQRVFLGPYSVVYGHGGVEIGDCTLIAMHCCILSSNHTVPGRTGQIRDEPDILLPTRIGRDVWLGAGVVVLGGVTIGDGCVVGAGSVVTRDLPDHSIAMGVPARVTGQRK